MRKLISCGIMDEPKEVQKGINIFLKGDFNQVIIPLENIPNSVLTGNIDEDSAIIGLDIDTPFGVGMVGENYVIARVTTSEPNPFTCH
jgi:hypothetical protein